MLKLLYPCIPYLLRLVHKGDRRYNIKATFTLLRCHLDPFLLPKTELFFFPVHTTPFSDRNGYLSLGVHICPEKRICLTASFMLALLVAFSNCSLFGVHTTKLRFCLAPFSFSSVFIIVFIWCLG